MSSSKLFPLKHVRSYRQSGHELVVEIHNEQGRLMAVGHCSCLKDYPQIVLNNVCLPVEVYGYESQRWLYTAMSWLRGDRSSANFESEETLFEEDYLE